MSELTAAEQQSAFDYACALGRYIGGHGANVIYNVEGKAPLTNKPPTYKEHKKQIMIDTVRKHGGNIAAAARELEITYTTLYRTLGSKKEWTFTL